MSYSSYTEGSYQEEYSSSSDDATYSTYDTLESGVSSSVNDDGGVRFRSSAVTPGEGQERADLPVVWSSVNFSVTKGGKKKVILNDCSGFADPGEMVALMGPSGAGKTSLMHILAGRGKATSGDVLIGGHTLTGENREPLLRHMAYVMQDDALLGSLTVEENITFAAKLKVRGSEELRRSRVNEMIEILGLEKVRHSAVGDVFRRGVSGGERKRVAIAMELVTHPTLIFLDEPTSGLDSSAALHVMTAVQRYAEKLNSTVITVIHQPPSAVFELFDRIVLLSDGRTVYSGSVDACRNFFEDNGHRVKANFNPAEVYLDILAKPLFTADEGGKKRADGEIKDMVRSYRDSDEYADVRRGIDKTKRAPPSDIQILSRKVPGSLGTSWANQAFTLTRRQVIEIIRNPLFLWVRIILYAALGVMIATVWLNIDKDNQDTLQDRFSLYFFSVAFLAFCAASAVPAFIADRIIYQRERASRAYGPSAYVFANSITSLAMVFIISVVYFLIVYFATNLNTTSTERPFGFFLALFLALLVAEWLVVLIAATTRFMIIGITMASMFNGMCMVVQGYFLRKNNLPGFYRNTLHWISYQKYSFEMIAVNDLRGEEFACAIDEATGNPRCLFPTAIANATSMTGEDILRGLDYQDVSFAEWTVVLIGMAVIFRIATYLVLKLRR